MDEIFGKSKFFWIMFVSLFLVLFLFSFLVLPKFVALFVNSSKQTSFEEVDYHQSLQFTLDDGAKLEEVEQIFSDIFANDQYKKVNVIITDIPQAQKITWIGENNQVINHLGYDVYQEGDNLSVYLYNNTAALRTFGWDVEKIARENEILLIKALMYQRGWPLEKINEESKKVFLSLHDQYSQPLFLMTYDF
ncbi:MAG: hypothetical protein OEX81_05565 [Candidatus Pacebacteria bacterium]|nr:hypothetical protein [Candidatus Paceibacterota bacterium]